MNLTFIQDNLNIILGGLGIIVFLILLLVLMKKPKKEPVKVQPSELIKEPLKEAVIEKPVEETPAVKEEVLPVVETEQPLQTKKTKKVESVSNEENDEDDPSKDVLSKDKPARYHVSQNKDEKSPHFKKWRIRKEGSTKTIKFYETQKEAIDAASDLAEKAGTTIVIHKMDGTIRKQDYSKK